jgi:cell division protein FtsB
MRLIYLFLCIVVGYLALTYFKGLSVITSTGNELKIAQENTLKLERRNEIIRSDINSLQTSKDYEIYEDLARSNLGYKKKEEVFYRVYGVNNNE